MKHFAYIASIFAVLVLVALGAFSFWRSTHTSSESSVPLADGANVPWMGVYHSGLAVNGLKTYTSKTIGISLKYPSDYLLFTRQDAGVISIIITPTTSTLEAIDRAKAGVGGERPGTITLSLFPDSKDETISSLPAWLSANKNVSNYDPINDPTTKLVSTTVVGMPALSYRTLLGLYPFDYRALVRNGRVVLISAADIPDQDFQTVLVNLSFAQ